MNNLRKKKCLFFFFILTYCYGVFSLFLFYCTSHEALCVYVSLTVCDFNSHTKKWPNGLNASALSLFLHSETCLTSLFIKKSLTCHKGLGDFDKVGWTHTVLWHEKYLHTPRVLYVALWCTQHLGNRSKSLPQIGCIPETLGSKATNYDQGLVLCIEGWPSPLIKQLAEASFSNFLLHMRVYLGPSAVKTSKRDSA